METAEQGQADCEAKVYLRDEVVQDRSRGGGGGGRDGVRRGGRSFGSRWSWGGGRGEELGGEGLPAGEVAEALGAEAEERAAAAAQAGDLGVGARRRLRGGGRRVGVEPAGHLVDEALIVADVKLLLLLLADAGGGRDHGLRRRGHGRRRPQPWGSAHPVVHGRAAAGRRGGIRNFELGFGRQERGWPMWRPPHPPPPKSGPFGRRAQAHLHGNSRSYLPYPAK